MAVTRATPRTYDRAVSTLARWHAGLRPAKLEIYSFPDPAETVVRLLEISEDFPASGQVLPSTFGSSPEFPFRSSVALLTPGEWREVLEGTLSLPEGWDLHRRQRVWPNGG